MKYISQLNAFYELLPSNPLGPKAICLYSVLLHINNKCLWKARFTVANTYLVTLTGIDRRTLDRIRNELIQKNYIEYKKGKGNQAGEYRIIPLYAQNDTQNDLIVQNDTQKSPCVHFDTQFVTQNDTQTVTQYDHINRQDKTIYSILLENARKNNPINYFGDKIKALKWAKEQEDWNLLSPEEQLKFINDV